MNGIVSIPSSRSFKNTLGMTAATLCLAVGFVAGTQVSIANVTRAIQQKFKTYPAFAAFRSSSINVQKISWIEGHLGQNIQSLRLVGAQNQMLDIDVSFRPFQLAENAPGRPIVVGAEILKTTAKKAKKSNILELEKAIHQLVETQKAAQAKKLNLFSDFQRASRELREDFKVAMLSPKEARAQLLAYEERKEKQRSVASVHLNPAQVELKDEPEVVVMNASSAMKVSAPKQNPQQLAAVEFTIPERKIHQEEVQAQEPDLPVAEVEYVRSAEKTTQEEAQMGEVHFSNVLTQAERKELTEALLAVQVERNVPRLAQIRHQEVQRSRSKIRRPTAVTRSSTPRLSVKESEASSIEEQTQSVESKSAFAAAAAAVGTNGYPCGILDHQKFSSPSNTALVGEGNQICPLQKNWISKNWSGEGWVMLSGDQHWNTLMYYPAPSDGSTLLLNQNAIALLAISGRTHTIQGTGMILGRAPEGYKVEFLGRAENTQYFTTNDQRHFAILNAEVGAGVVQLVSESDPSVSATLFTPVVADTITYLDLSIPRETTIPIQIVKNGTRNDPEVVGLKVRVSTQKGLGAITGSRGQAQLKSVYTIGRYPIYLDVASKMRDREGYFYRYEIQPRTHRGVRVLNQVSEHSLFKWMKQVNSPIGNQSAMVVGFMSRKRLDGFRRHFYSKVVPYQEEVRVPPLNYSILWDGQISSGEPLEGDLPRFMSLQIPQGMSRVMIVDEAGLGQFSKLFPISPRMIHVVSE